MKLKVERICNDLRDDFYRVHCDAYESGWCFCSAWWVPTWDNWSERTAHENREIREKLLASDVRDGYILYCDNEPVGWCQCVLRDDFEKLTMQFHLRPNPDCWAITCFLIVPKYRDKRLAHKLLDLVLSDLKGNGIRQVQAFPRRGQNLSKDDLWTGPEEIYIRAGFAIMKDDPVKPVYEKLL